VDEENWIEFYFDGPGDVPAIVATRFVVALETFARERAYLEDGQTIKIGNLNEGSFFGRFLAITSLAANAVALGGLAADIEQELQKQSATEIVEVCKEINRYTGGREVRIGDCRTTTTYVYNRDADPVSLIFDYRSMIEKLGQQTVAVTYRDRFNETEADKDDGFLRLAGRFRTDAAMVYFRLEAWDCDVDFYVEKAKHGIQPVQEDVACYVVLKDLGEFEGVGRKARVIHYQPLSIA
jgi:hypothetical protein